MEGILVPVDSWVTMVGGLILLLVAFSGILLGDAYEHDIDEARHLMLDDISPVKTVNQESDEEGEERKAA